MKGRWEICFFSPKAGVLAAVPVEGGRNKDRKREAGFNKLCRKGVLQTVAMLLEWDQSGLIWAGDEHRRRQEFLILVINYHEASSCACVRLSLTYAARPGLQWWVLFSQSFASVGRGPWTNSPSLFLLLLLITFSRLSWKTYVRCGRRFSSCPLSWSADLLTVAQGSKSKKLL